MVRRKLTGSVLLAGAVVALLADVPDQGLDLRIYVIPTDGGAQRRLPSGSAQSLDWSPRGEEIAYGFAGAVRRGRYTDRYAGIYVANGDGSTFHQVTSHAYNEYGFAWSPDGRWLLYGRANREGIYLIGADGHNKVQLTSSAAGDSDPSWVAR